MIEDRDARNNALPLILAGLTLPITVFGFYFGNSIPIVS